MSRMTAPRVVEKPQPSTEAAAIVAVMHEMQAMDRRWATWREEMTTNLQKADALITGLHQDNANLMIRLHALMRWAHKHWETFDTEIQAEYDAVLAEIEEKARTAMPDVTTQEEAADAKPNQDHVSV